MNERNERWEREASFFDQKAKAERAAGLRVSELTVQRYGEAKHAEMSAEYRFVGLGSIKGLRVLDIGCGDGRATVLLALLGANVTGIDISPDAIEVAKERAATNGVGERCSFICSPLEIADIPPGSFDVVWCDAFLHHVIPDLHSILTRMKSWLVDGGRIVITEPVNLSPVFRALRLALLPAPDATPDERPLEEPELEIIRSVFPKHQARYFGLLSRAAHYALPNGNYELAPPSRKKMFSSASQLDQLLFGVGLRRLSSQVIFHGQK